MNHANVAESPPSLPLDRCRRFAGDVVNHAVDTADFVDDPVGDFAEQFVRQVRPLRGHEVLCLYGAQRDDIFIRSAVTHDADGFDGQKDGECLTGGIVPAHRFAFFRRHR